MYIYTLLYRYVYIMYNVWMRSYTYTIKSLGPSGAYMRR